MFRLDKKRWVYWFAFISIFLISGSVLAASWYSTLSQSFASTGSASTVHTFTLPSNQKVASGGYIKIELTGDFDAADEYADLYIEGTYIGKATGGSATCGANVTKNFTLSQANLEKWGADGKIVVTVKNSSAVSGCADTQRKHGLALSVTNLVSSQPVKTLSKVRINCTTPIVEGLTGTCSAFADFSDNSTQTVTPSITNWKADRAASISTSGVITALPVSADTFVTITGNYTYNGVTMTGIGSTTVKDDSISGLREFRISCPTSFNENTSIQCRSYAKIDGTEREVTTSSTWSENASYTSITPTGGLLTAVEVIGDSGVVVKASYSYGGVTKAAEQLVSIKDVPILPTALTITCPSSIDESSTANCTAKVTLSNNTTSDVTSSSQWASSSAFATVDTNGKITTQAVTADQHININASYTTSGITKTATAALTIKDVPTTTGKTVNIKNRFKGSLITFNGNSDWLLTAVSGFNTICEKLRPTYCLNVASGSLQSSVISNTSPYAHWSIEDYDGYKRIRNIGYSTYYIHHESTDIMAGDIQPGWWSAQWILEEVSSSTSSIGVNLYTQADTNIKLIIDGESEWVFIADDVYRTGGYRICEKWMLNYCINIEHGTLRSSKIETDWMSAIWMKEDAGNGYFRLNNRWKPGIYINSDGLFNSTTNQIRLASRGIVPDAWTIEAALLPVAPVSEECYERSDVVSQKTVDGVTVSIRKSTIQVDKCSNAYWSVTSGLQSGTYETAIKALCTNQTTGLSSVENVTSIRSGALSIKDCQIKAYGHFNKNNGIYVYYTPKSILLLHGLNSDPSTWQTYINYHFSGKPGINNCKVIYNGQVTDESITAQNFSSTSSSLLNHTSCYALKFGSKDTQVELNGQKCTNSNGCNGDYSTFTDLGSEVEAAINAISLIEGDNSKIILVGHSRGGLAATRFLQKGVSTVKSKVAGLVTTGTPYSGSRFGRLCGRSDILDLLAHPETITTAALSSSLVQQNKELKELLEKPSVCYLSDLSNNIATMKTDMPNLPSGIKYAEIVYGDQKLGNLTKDYNIFLLLSLWAPTLAAKLNEELLAPETPESLHGDGIVNFDSQHLSKILRSSNLTRDIVTYLYRNTGTLHTQEPKQVDHIGDAILGTIQRIN